MLNHHRLPDSSPEPIQAPSGNEIRFPTCSGSHNTRSARRNDHDSIQHEA